MAMVQFTRNYTDHSNDQGFQFEFHCDKCGNGYRSLFVASKVGMAASFLRAASSLLGGLSGAASAGEHMKDALRGRAWDDAFNAAVVEGKQHFKQCTRCGKWVCPDVCWNEKRSLCEDCAPDLAQEAAAAQAQAAVQQIHQKAAEEDLVADIDMKVDQVAACPHCNARVEGGKFCPECGKPLAAKNTCPRCGAQYGGGAKFCPGCGAPRPR